MDEINNFLNIKRLNLIAKHFEDIEQTETKYLISNFYKELEENSPDSCSTFLESIENQINYPKLFNSNGLDINNSENYFTYMSSSMRLMNRIETPDKIADRNILKRFKELDLFSNNLNLDDVYSCYSNTLKYKQIIDKSMRFSDNFNLKNTDKDFINEFKSYNDRLNKKLLKFSAKKLMRSIISNKYKHLINERTEELFLRCAKSENNIDNLAANIGHKIASMKTSEQFNDYISDTLGFDIEWNKDSVIEQIERNNGDIIEIKDNKIFVDISDFEQICRLGSTHWCVKNHKENWFEYGYSKADRFVLVYDLDEPVTSPYSKLGVMLQGSNVKEVYDKLDHSCDKKDSKLSNVYNILSNLKPSSLKTINLKNNYLNKTYKEDIQIFDDYFNDFIFLNILKNKSFDLYNEIKDEYINNSNEISHSFYPVFKNLVSNSDKELYNFIIDNKVYNNFERLSNNEKSYLILIATANQFTDDKEYNKSLIIPSVDNALQNIKKNIQSSISYKDESLPFFNKNKEIFNNIMDTLMKYDIKSSDLLNSVETQWFSKINDNSLSNILDREPNILDKLYENKPQVAALFLLRANISDDVLHRCLNGSSSDNSTFINKRLNVLNKQENNISIEKERCHSILNFYENRNKNKNNNKYKFKP